MVAVPFSVFLIKWWLSPFRLSPFRCPLFGPLFVSPFRKWWLSPFRFAFVPFSLFSFSSPFPLFLLIVVDIAKDADKDGDEFCVIYRALYDHGQGQLYSTAIERFTSMKDENTPRPRFRFLEIGEANRNPDHAYPTMTM